MRIALITDGIYPYVMGGMQKHSYNLAQQLALKGVQLQLVHGVYGQELPPEQGADPAHFREEALRQMAFSCVRFPLPDRWPGHYLRQHRAYSRLVYQHLRPRLNDFDFIYVKGFAGWELLKKRHQDGIRPPVGINFHGYEMYQRPPSFKARLAQHLLRGPVKWNTLHADYVFSYGGKISDIIAGLGVGRSRILEVPAGIEQSWLHTSPASSEAGSGPRKFVFLGRYERRKGIEELLAVLEELLQADGLPFEFHFIGPIPEERQISHPSLIFHGPVGTHQQVQALLRQCEVLVCPSHSEGMPNVILEAMACGLAVIGTDVGAVARQIRGNGWLLPGPEPRLLKTAITEAIELPREELQRMQQRSLALVREHFLWEQVASQTITHIENAVKQHHPNSQSELPV